MKESRLVFRPIRAYMSSVYLLLAILTAAAIWCACKVGLDTLLIVLFALLYLIAVLLGVVFALLPENKTIVITPQEIIVRCRKHPEVCIIWTPDIYVGVHLFQENVSPMLHADSYEVVISNVHWAPSAELTKRQSYPYIPFDPNGPWVISCGRCSQKTCAQQVRQIHQLRGGAPM